MTHMGNARRFAAGAEGSLDGAGDTQQITRKKCRRQVAGGWRAVMHRLSAAARGGLLPGYEAGFVVSIERQSRQRGWRPSARQIAFLVRINAALRKPDADHRDGGGDG
jgi:hypothetical protein